MLITKKRKKERKNSDVPFYEDFSEIKVCVCVCTFQNITKNLKVLQIILLLRLNISVKFKHNSFISLKVI